MAQTVNALGRTHERRLRVFRRNVQLNTNAALLVADAVVPLRFFCLNIHSHLIFPPCRLIRASLRPHPPKKRLLSVMGGY